MITEEFSFPIITSNNVVHLTVLPPLWRISSINQSDADELEQENGRNKRKVIFRSFSQVEGEIIKKESINLEKAAEAEAAAAEEKMDMLWEDFNEEASCNYSMENSTAPDSETNNNNYDFQEEFDQDKCNIKVHESERPCRKKKRLEMVGKIVKKLFWLRNRARIKKRGPNI